MTKKFFLQLCILISRKDSSIPTSIDIFMQPLIEELQRLWSRIPAQDFRNPPGERRF
jgi:hypothetical protein